MLTLSIIVMKAEISYTDQNIFYSKVLYLGSLWRSTHCWNEALVEELQLLVSQLQFLAPFVPSWFSRCCLPVSSDPECVREAVTSAVSAVVTGV